MDPSQRCKKNVTEKGREGKEDQLGFGALM